MIFRGICRFYGGLMDFGIVFLAEYAGFKGPDGFLWPNMPVLTRSRNLTMPKLGKN